MPPVPIYVKGGVWSNIEDQILKAAIQKYGTHQWSKVSSLLQKKTAKQCESRWSEYLNPNLNFKEFSKDDDAKLLDLARKLPNQWRTIAGVMGRTAQFCIERYNKLLEGEDSELALGSSLEFNVGDVNLNAETQPAKPDEDELDDDEREMLAEARARLLNTQGKKATRKIRERMLEESKRVAHLQKRRELKQAGIESKIKAPKKKYDTQIDYNADVVYEQQPTEGVYDTTQEDERTAKSLANFERSVNRKGLSDDKKGTGRESEPKKKRIREERAQVTGENTVVTNEFKKPKLELPGPHSTGQHDLQGQIDTNRQQILQSKRGTPIFDDDSERIAVVQKNLSKVSASGNSILHLFEKLPQPKNDFEILLDDEEVIDTPEQISLTENLEMEDSYSKAAIPANVTDKEMVKTHTQELLRQDLPLPELILNASTPIDREFNAIIGSSLMTESLESTHEYLQVKKQVDIQMEDYDHESYKAKVQNLISSRISTPEIVKDYIEATGNNIEALKASLEHASALEKQNATISFDMLMQSIPHITHLQQLYHVYYRMYQNEYYAIEQRKQRLKKQISDASSVE